MEQLKEWDSDLFVYLNSLGIEDYDAFWIFVTQIRHWVPLFILFFVLYFLAFRWKRAVLSILSLILAFVTTLGLTNITKSLVARLRPNNVDTLAEVIRVLQTPDNYSFFSGHASSSFVVTTFVVLTLRSKYKWIYVMYIWPLLFIMSRIYVGVHYPGDILVGAFVGTVIAILFYKSYKRVGSEYLGHQFDLHHTPPPGATVKKN